MSGYVYAVRSGDFVKIGWSKNPRRRITKMSTDSPHPCLLVGCTPGSKADEAAAHELLNAHHSHREWYRYEGAVIEFVASLPPPPALEGRKRNALQAARRDGGSTQQDLAKLLGVTQSTLSRWERGRTTPRIDRFLKLAAATGVPIEQIAKIVGVRLAGAE